MNNYDKLTTECLTEMFKRVGLEYPDEELTKQNDWYMQHSWTESEEADFKAWMLKKAKKAKLFRPEMEVAMFMLDWGWTTKEEV